MYDLDKMKSKQVKAIRKSRNPSFTVTYEGSEFKVYGDKNLLQAFAGEMYLHMKQIEGEQNGRDRGTKENNKDIVQPDTDVGEESSSE